MMLWIGPQRYDAATRGWFARQDHYLANAPPGCLYAIGVTAGARALLGEYPRSVGPLLGLCIVGRPVARHLPQDGSMGEILRIWLTPGLPYGTASRVLRRAIDEARHRGMATLIAYHDRSRHTGCIYKKSGFHQDGTTDPRAGGWGSRSDRKSGDYPAASKRRWRIDIRATGSGTADS